MKILGYVMKLFAKVKTKEAFTSAFSSEIIQCTFHCSPRFEDATLNLINFDAVFRTDSVQFLVF